MQHPPPLLEQTAIGDLVRQGVFEGVLVLWEEPRLIQEFGGLEVRQAAGNAASGSSTIACNRGKGTSVR